MSADADEALKNVIVDGMLKDISEAWKRKSYRAVLILIYSAIDAMAHLTMPEDKDKVTRADFIAWAEKYMRFRDASGQRTLTLPGLELYAARCAIVHTYSSEADLHKNGDVKRQIGYGDEFIPEIATDPNVENLVMVSIRGLIDALNIGVAETLKDIVHDEPRRMKFAARLGKMMHELPAMAVG